MTGHPKFPLRVISPDMPENAITERIIKCAIEVHRQLSPGLLENVYEEALVLTYLKITGKRVGLLINFNSRLVKDGIKRFIL